MCIIYLHYSKMHHYNFKRIMNVISFVITRLCQPLGVNDYWSPIILGFGSLFQPSASWMVLKLLWLSTMLWWALLILECKSCTSHKYLHKPWLIGDGHMTKEFKTIIYYQQSREPSMVLDNILELLNPLRTKRPIMSRKVSYNRWILSYSLISKNIKMSKVTLFKTIIFIKLCNIP